MRHHVSGYNFTICHKSTNASKNGKWVRRRDERLALSRFQPTQSHVISVAGRDAGSTVYPVQGGSRTSTHPRATPCSLRNTTLLISFRELTSQLSINVILSWTTVGRRTPVPKSSRSYIGARLSGVIPCTVTGHRARTLWAEQKYIYSGRNRYKVYPYFVFGADKRRIGVQPLDYRQFRLSRVKKMRKLRKCSPGHLTTETLNGSSRGAGLELFFFSLLLCRVDWRIW